MNAPRIQSQHLFLALALVAAPSVIAAPAPVVTPAPARAEENTATKSVFVDRPNFGRDPFFPTSTRRGQVIDTSPVEPTANFANIVLKGISVAAGKGLAIINNKTFEAGEEGELRINNQPVKIKCVEIKEKSVVISINGVSKELSLSSRF